ncbi:MAG: DNA-processing protein DprA [Eggerthellaceae bacterium]|nr:DNA-processing protein DprA [Eggerthellaceae bacterium]
MIGALSFDLAAFKYSNFANMRTIVFLGKSTDHIYPAQNTGLFKKVVDGDGVLVSEIE